MIKAVYIAEDDSYLGLRTGDVIDVEYLDDECGYLYVDEFGERFFIEAWEVEEIKGE